MKTWLIGVLGFFLAGSIAGQSTHLRFAFTADIGSQFRKGGLLFQANYVRNNRVEVFSAVQLKFVLQGMGPQKNSSELSLHSGISGGLGSPFFENRPITAFAPFTLITNQGRNVRIAYTYNHYFDKHETSQGTGTITLKFGDLYVISENDLFGNLKGLDRYRTGALGVYLRRGDYYGGLKTMLWTGQTKCKGMARIRNADFPSRFGYKDIEQCKYSHLSHGILSGEFGYIRNNMIMPSISIGKDDERIRNMVQNQIIHDMHFMPKKWNSAENPHIPMIDKEGKAYLYKKDQELKKGKWFVQAALNHGWFY
jgi:hypothetical protein